MYRKKLQDDEVAYRFNGAPSSQTEKELADRKAPTGGSSFNGAPSSQTEKG